MRKLKRLTSLFLAVGLLLSGMNVLPASAAVDETNDAQLEGTGETLYVPNFSSLDEFDVFSGNNPGTWSASEGTIRIDGGTGNKAVAKDQEFTLKTKNEFMKILEVNLVGTYLLSKKIGLKMLDRKQGSIINISSTNGIDTTYPESIDYDASKAGVISLTHNFANYFAPYIRVNTICPGWINTDMTKNLDEEFAKKEKSKILLNRFAEKEEIATLAYFLGTDKASYINDSIIRIDGGVKSV